MRSITIWEHPNRNIVEPPWASASATKAVSTAKIEGIIFRTGKITNMAERREYLGQSTGGSRGDMFMYIV